MTLKNKTKTPTTFWHVHQVPRGLRGVSDQVLSSSMPGHPGFGARQEAPFILFYFLAFSSTKDLRVTLWTWMGLFLQQDWLFNKKSSNEAFSVRLGIPSVHMSRTQLCTSEPGGTVPTAYPDLGVAVVRPAFQATGERRGTAAGVRVLWFFGVRAKSPSSSVEF